MVLITIIIFFLSVKRAQKQTKEQVIMLMKVKKLDEEIENLKKEKNKEDQILNGVKYNELIFVQERNELAELWTGKRLGVEGVQDELGFRVAFNGKEFSSYDIDFSKFDKILFENFNNDALMVIAKEVEATLKYVIEISV